MASLSGVWQGHSALLFLPLGGFSRQSPNENAGQCGGIPSSSLGMRIGLSFHKQALAGVKIRGEYREDTSQVRHWPYGIPVRSSVVQSGCGPRHSCHRSRTPRRRHSRQRLLPRNANPVRALPADPLPRAARNLRGSGTRQHAVRWPPDPPRNWPRYLHRPPASILPQRQSMGSGLNRMPPLGKAPSQPCRSKALDPGMHVFPKRQRGGIAPFHGT